MSKKHYRKKCEWISSNWIVYSGSLPSGGKKIHTRFWSIKCNSMFKIWKLTAHDVRHEKWKLKRKQMLPIMCVKWYMNMGLWWNCMQKLHWICNSVNTVISMNSFLTFEVDNVPVATQLSSELLCQRIHYLLWKLLIFCLHLADETSYNRSSESKIFSFSFICLKWKKEIKKNRLKFIQVSPD